jgi:hypothetical protein
MNMSLLSFLPRLTSFCFSYGFECRRSANVTFVPHHLPPPMTVTATAKQGQSKALPSAQERMQNQRTQVLAPRLRQRRQTQPVAGFLLVAGQKRRIPVSGT